MASRTSTRASGVVAFDTVLGRCVLAFTPRGVRELHLPEPGEALRRGRVPATGRERASTETAAGEGREPLRPIARVERAPAWVRRVVRRVQRHLEGRLDPLDDVPLDLPDGVSAFDRAIWEAARRVPPGLTITYGELAEEAGRPGAARACGSAMARCPVGLLVPAHRVIAAGRRPGGWTGPGGVVTKLRLLQVEGVDLARARRRR